MIFKSPEINGIVAVENRLISDPSARLKINGMFLNFSGANYDTECMDSYMTNVALTYEPKYARGLNSSAFSKARLIFWRELP